MSERAKQVCPHCGRPFTIGAGLSRHQRACQYKEHERAGTAIDLMALLRHSLAKSSTKRSGREANDVDR